MSREYDAEASSCGRFFLLALIAGLPACANTHDVTAVAGLTSRIADEVSVVAGTDAVLADHYMEWRSQGQFSLSNPDATCEPAFAFFDNGLLSRNRVASGTACTQYTFGELRVLPRSGSTSVEAVNVTATITHVGQGTGCSTINSVSPWVYLIEKCGVSGTGTYAVQLLTNTIYRMETNAQPHGAGNSYESLITLNLAGPTDDAPTTFTSENGPVNAAHGHSCALRKNGSTVCWSYGPYGQLNVPAAERLTRVSTGFATSCGIRENKTIGCWGSDGSGQTNVPPGEFIQVSAGQYAVCGLRTNHTVTCWGGGIVSADNELPSGTYKEVSAGSSSIAASARTARSPVTARPTSASRRRRREPSCRSAPAKGPTRVPSARTEASCAGAAIRISSSKAFRRPARSSR